MGKIEVMTQEPVQTQQRVTLKKGRFRLVMFINDLIILYLNQK